jgi:hypothetical protein
MRHQKQKQQQQQQQQQQQSVRLRRGVVARGVLYDAVVHDLKWAVRVSA